MTFTSLPKLSNRLCIEMLCVSINRVSFLSPQPPAACLYSCLYWGEHSLWWWLLCVSKAFNVVVSDDFWEGKVKPMDAVNISNATIIMFSINLIKISLPTFAQKKFLQFPLIGCNRSECKPLHCCWILRGILPWHQTANIFSK